MEYERKGFQLKTIWRTKIKQLKTATTSKIPQPQKFTLMLSTWKCHQTWTSDIRDLRRSDWKKLYLNIKNINTKILMQQSVTDVPQTLDSWADINWLCWNTEWDPIWNQRIYLLVSIQWVNCWKQTIHQRSPSDKDFHRLRSFIFFLFISSLHLSKSKYESFTFEHFFPLCQ